MTTPNRALGGAVVATAGDGSCVVQRGSHVDVFGPDLGEPKSLPLGKAPEEDRNQYAVSGGARYVARVNRTGRVEVWDVATATRVARLLPGNYLSPTREIPLVGRAPETAMSRGAPVFLGDDLLATHHLAGVVLWDVPSWRVRCAIEDPCIHVARYSHAFGRGRAVIRSQSQAPGLFNAVLVEVRTTDGAVVDRHHVRAYEPLAVANSDRETFVLTYDGIRTFEASRAVREVPADGTAMPLALAATPDGRWVVSACGVSGGTVITAWSREHGTVTSVAELEKGAPRIVHLRIEDGHVHVLDSAGGVWCWPLPSAGGTAIVERAIDDSERARQLCIIETARGEYGSALAALDSIQDRAARDASRFFRAYLKSIVDSEDLDDFLPRLERQGIRPCGDPGTLAAAGELVAAESHAAAFDLFVYWIRGATPGSASAAGIDVGLGLAQQLQAAGKDELRDDVLGHLHTVYPDEPDVLEALALASEDDEDEDEET